MTRGTTAFLLLFLLIIAAINASASDSYRSYQRECKGKVKCMKTQAASYVKFRNGNFEEHIKRVCREQHVLNYNKNYAAALICARKMQKKHEEQELRRAKIEHEKAAAEYNEERKKVIKREYHYQRCRKRGLSAKYCMKKYL